MQPIRVVIIDGDVVVRQILARLLESAPDIRVVGIASNGPAGRTLITKTRPDVVLLDLERLSSDSLSLLREVRGAYPRLPVIALSTRSRDGARRAVDALESGAAEFVTKPEGTSHMLFATRHLRKRLVPSVRAVVSAHRDDPLPEVSESRKLDDASASSVPANGKPVELVVIGGCTGGPQALFALLPALPRSLAAPVLIVQHMPKGYTAVLAERLSQRARRPVAEARAGVGPAPGQIWIAPGGFHLTLHRSAAEDRLGLHRGPREHGCRPAIDVLFRAAAALHGPHVLGVMLSGHGRDGLEGCRHLREAGGRVLVQEPQSALAWELPGAVAQAGLAEMMLTPEALGREIGRRANPVLLPGGEAASAQHSAPLAKASTRPVPPQPMLLNGGAAL